MIIQAFILTLVIIKAWDAKAKQNKEIKAMLISIMKLIKKITTHYYLLHDYTRFYSYFVN
jgi:hypothetical protein